MRIEGRVVAISGAGSGIGAAIAREAARRGAAAITVIDIDEAAGQQISREISVSGPSGGSFSRPRGRGGRRQRGLRRGGTKAALKNREIGANTSPAECPVIGGKGATISPSQMDLEQKGFRLYEASEWYPATIREVVENDRTSASDPMRPRCAWGTATTSRTVRRSSSETPHVLSCAFRGCR